MPRGPIYEKGYKPQFTGHETFPLRYGWLKKAYDAVYPKKDKSVFSGDQAIARFGVGKNMVSSIRHWATAAGIIKDGKDGHSLETTQFGDKIFASNGRDPYLEHPSTLWLIHWHLAGQDKKTTYFWTFNNFAGATFEREKLVNSLLRLTHERDWKRVSPTTIRRDVDCFIRTYSMKQPTAKLTSLEDMLESPLAELGLIKATSLRDGFRFVRGVKSNLQNGVFLYALIQFWKKYTDAFTLSFEDVAHKPGSPGRVFLLDENDVAEHLISLEEFSAGKFRWSETAGLKQVIRKESLDCDKTALEYACCDHPININR